MQDSSHFPEDGSNRSAAATFGLDNLELGIKTSEASALQMPKKSSDGINQMPKLRHNGPSKLNRSSWRRAQQVPSYEPLNVPPLGSTRNRSTQPGEDADGTLDNTSNQSARASQSTAARTPEDPSTSERAPTSGSFHQNSKQYSTAQVQYSVPASQLTANRFIDFHAGNNGSKQCLSVQARIGALRPTTPPQLLGRWFKPAPSPKQNPRSPKVRSAALVHAIKPPPTPVPVPDPAYITLSAVPAIQLPYPQPLLVVLDLNGTLLYRPVASSHHKPRPSLQLFLTHCLANYSLLIWSSATPHNVRTICSRIFTSAERKTLLGEWARDTLDLTPEQYAAKVQVFKRLDRIWNNDSMQRAHPRYLNGGRWSQENTLLLDDSALKASAQPYNAVVVPEFAKGDSIAKQNNGPDVLGQVVSYLETARTHNDVSSFVRKRPFKVNDGWACAWPEACNRATTSPAPRATRTSRRSRQEDLARGSTVIDLTAESDAETSGIAL
ncbi:MAG: hypothetical protein LQ346_000232 [Caloplaca aetnensis]|nr:MAG: hypothetical protein LQ346_000232 [Caloplaca aetnensis]